ncbi:MAG: DUF697 domain-containing protein [Chitinophagales bacterium]
MDELTRKDKAEDIVNHNIFMSMGAGTLPIPFVDVIAVTSVQMSMLKDLCELYDVRFSENLAKNAITALAGTSLARLGASAVKTIPGFGTFFGSVSMAILSGASTYALGQVFITNLEGGRTILDFDLEEGKNLFARAFEEGKEYVSNLDKEQGGGKANADNKPPVNPKPTADKSKRSNTNEEDTFALLEKLGRLKEKGIITEEEFLKKKEDLLKRL